MSTLIRHALCATIVVGALSLGACKTTDGSMSASESASSANSSRSSDVAPMHDDASAPPMEDASTQPMDDSDMQSDDAGTDSATPATP